MSELVNVLCISSLILIVLFMFCHTYFGVLHKYTGILFKVLMIVVCLYTVNIGVVSYLTIERIEILLDKLDPKD